jgi:hypothetical protein
MAQPILSQIREGFSHPFAAEVESVAGDGTSLEVLADLSGNAQHWGRSYPRRARR